MDGRTDIVTPWAPVGAKNSKKSDIVDTAFYS